MSKVFTGDNRLTPYGKGLQDGICWGMFIAAVMLVMVSL